MLDFFSKRENINNLRNFRVFQSEKKKNIRYGTETVTYKAAQLGKLLPYDIKNSPTLIEFKDKIKTWSTDNFPGRLCKTYFKKLAILTSQIPSP